MVGTCRFTHERLGDARVRIAVAGGSGFIGSHVMQVASTRGLGAIGLSTRDLPGLIRVSHPGELPEADTLIHLAQESHRATVNQRSTAEQDAELAFSRALIDRYPHVVLASTAVLYGDGSAVPHPETDPVFAPDAYARAKLATEDLTLSRGGTVVRLANVYGPGQRRSSAVNDLIYRARGTGVVSTAYGSAVRDFVHVTDVAKTLIKISLEPVGGVFNIGTGTGNSVAQVAGILADLMALPCLIDSPETALSSVLVVDPRKVHEQWILDPALSLRAGLALTLGDTK